MWRDNAIRCIRYVHNDRKLWIDFQFTEDAETFAESPDWMLENQSVYRGLPDTVSYTFVTGNVFGLGFQDADSAVTWSDTSYKKLWKTPDEPHGTGPLAHERCMTLFCNRPRLWTAFGKELPVEDYSIPRKKQITKPRRRTGVHIKHSWKGLRGRLSKATDGTENSGSSD